MFENCKDWAISSQAPYLLGEGSTTIEQIKEAVDYLSTTQNKFTRINLV